eukprot:8324620-Pyramimonas_sp.AAC.1
MINARPLSGRLNQRQVLATQVGPRNRTLSETHIGRSPTQPTASTCRRPSASKPHSLALVRGQRQRTSRSIGRSQSPEEPMSTQGSGHRLRAGHAHWGRQPTAP